MIAPRLIPLLCCLAFSGVAQETLDTLPPVVVKTVPAAGESKVDPAVKEIRVTFSKQMTTKQSWSMVTVKRAAFPKINGPLRFMADGRTFVAPVKLDPGKTYALWINQDKFTGFRDAGNHPAVPYLLVFKTRE